MAARLISDIKIIDGVEYKRCLHPQHSGDRYVILAKMQKRKNRPIPYGSNCLECFNLYNRAARNTDEKRQKNNYNATQYIRKRRKERGMGWSIWHSAKNRAQRASIPFTITPEDVVVPDVCPILGISLIKDTEYILRSEHTSQLNLPNYPSIDRIIPELGYVKGNIAVISWRANNIKSNATLQELESVVEWMAEQYKNVQTMGVIHEHTNKSAIQSGNVPRKA